MPVPLTIVLLVAAQDAREPALATFTQATRHALGADTHVLVAEADAPDDPKALEQAYRADALVALAWSGQHREDVQIRVHRKADDGWVVREIRFGKGDRAAEQGRTLGFTVAAMFPEQMAEALASPRPQEPDNLAPVAEPPLRPPPREPKPEPKPSAVARPKEDNNISEPPVSEVERALAQRQPSAAGTAGAERDSSRAPVGWSTAHGDIAASGIVAADLGGAGGGFGGMLRGDLFLGRYWSLRAVVAARTGSVAAAKASSSIVTGGLGVALHTLRTRAEMPFDLSASVDALAIRQALSHFDSDDGESVNEARFIPGAETTVSFAWMLTPALGVFLDAGGEFAFGTTRIYLRGAEVASIPPTHALVGLGATGRF